jgi:hypothetical protein
LNPEKCVFGVKKGKFLGCLVSTKGIEANSNKIELFFGWSRQAQRRELSGWQEDCHL